jgi:hypothetical protein
VEFIPKSTKVTPDLRGRVGNTPVLCEVKTINCSDKEAIARRKCDVRLVEHILTEGLFIKLKNTLNSVKKQLCSYKQELYIQENTLNIIYVVLNFDDNLNEYLNQYISEINDRVSELFMPEIEILFDVKPPFYSATCESPASCRYVLRDGRTLTKLEDE